MTWTADNDAVGVDGNAPYAYSLGILSKLGDSLMSIHPNWEEMRRHMRGKNIGL